jgi:rhodanese-related sulfurtransferase
MAGPKQGAYTLIDSRPLPRFQEGAIPTATNLPYPAFDKFLDRLPKDKSKLLIFYCQGVTCAMSPSSLRRAEKMGYTNVKVYREGMPEWSQRNVGVMSPSALKEAWFDKDIPHVLVDARAAADVQSGFVKGAVAIAPEQVKAALPGFPAREMKAPIMVYDGGDGARALATAKLINVAGYVNVNVIEGGMRAWRAAGYPVASGTPATKIVYAPKPRPGQIPNDEFRKIVAATPADVLLLDVRNRDEGNSGMIKGAKLIPDEELAGRFAEVPKDKRIVVYCNTGVRAEMAYHKLKERGYNVSFVKADIEIDKSGKVKITDN